jgi:hypothetical protein
MRVSTGLALGLLLILGVAGCGGHDSSKVATAGSPTAKANSSAGSGGGNDQEQALKFAQCMRDNGVPNFPDPKFGAGGGVGISVPDGTDPQKADAAMQKCKQYMPNGGEPPKLDEQRLAQLRKLAQCMRDNGVSNFPDPTDNGIQANGNTSGIDPTDPKFEAAMKVCNKYGPPPPSGEPAGGGNQGGNG